MKKIIDLLKFTYSNFKKECGTALATIGQSLLEISRAYGNSTRWTIG